MVGAARPRCGPGAFVAKRRAASSYAAAAAGARATIPGLRAGMGCSTTRLAEGADPDAGRHGHRMPAPSALRPMPSAPGGLALSVAKQQPIRRLTAACRRAGWLLPRPGSPTAPGRESNADSQAGGAWSPEARAAHPPVEAASAMPKLTTADAVNTDAAMPRPSGVADEGSRTSSVAPAPTGAHHEGAGRLEAPAITRSAPCLIQGSCAEASARPQRPLPPPVRQGFAAEARRPASRGGSPVKTSAVP